jgi:hypothetical protein
MDIQLLWFIRKVQQKRRRLAGGFSEYTPMSMKRSLINLSDIHNLEAFEFQIQVELLNIHYKVTSSECHCTWTRCFTSCFWKLQPGDHIKFCPIVKRNLEIALVIEFTLGKYFTNFSSNCYSRRMSIGLKTLPNTQKSTNARKPLYLLVRDENEIRR